MARFSLIISIAFTLLTGSAWAVPAEGTRIMIAGPSPYSPQIARDIYALGGNAVDVIVAAAFELSVTHPAVGSLGGGGLAVVKMDGKITTLDFRETAPAAAGVDLYKGKAPAASRNGGLAVAIPGIPAGLFELHKRFGKLKWAQVIAPAQKMAEKGFLVSGEWAKSTARNADRFNAAAKRILFNKDGTPLKPGDLLKQPELAKMLAQISKKGPQAFYQGDGAKDIVATVTASGGIMTTDDLKNYKPRWLDPITAELGGYKLYLMPPPSSGGVVIAEAVKLIEKTKLKDRAPLSVEELHQLIEIEKLSFKGRALLGDPDFNKNPIDEMLDDKAIGQLAALINPDHALDPQSLLTPEQREILKNAPREKEQTTHMSVIDAKGNAVAMTVTLNGDYGSALLTNKFGIALNNEMDDFTTHLNQPNMFGLIQGTANQVRAGARPLSSMSPTIVEKDGKTYLAVGSPGGPRITSAVLQVLYRILVQNFDIDRAIQTARVHHQFLPNIVYTDKLRLPPETYVALTKKGHVISEGSTAKVYAVRLSDSGILEGAYDDRGEGGAGGY